MFCKKRRAAFDIPMSFAINHIGTAVVQYTESELFPDGRGYIYVSKYIPAHSPSSILKLLFI